MPSSGYVHGGTDAREVERLEKQARFTSQFSMREFQAAAGARVLDLATGVGATAGVLLARLPGIQLVGVDLNRAQLQQARRNHPGARYVRADAAHLPFPEGAFERVFCSWLLEHVPEPAAILREVRRVLAPGGYCQFTEVDNATFRLEPEDADVTAVMAALNQAQRQAGGDPFVGQRLAPLFAEAGFAKADVRYVPMVADASDPVFYRGMMEEFAEIFEGLDEALGADMMPRIDRAAKVLRSRVDMPGTRFSYSPVVARGFRE